jgi:hypothetical protein
LRMRLKSPPVAVSNRFRNSLSQEKNRCLV